MRDAFWGSPMGAQDEKEKAAVSWARETMELRRLKVVSIFPDNLTFQTIKSLAARSFNLDKKYSKHFLDLKRNCKKNYAIIMNLSDNFEALY